MPDDSVAFPAGLTVPCSQFTQHDLQLMARCLPESPLRVIALVDYDSFYAQYESVRLGLPASQPLAVRQWNAIIALNYPAKQQGLKRGISVEDILRLCPEITIQHIPTWREGDERWRYRSDVLDHLTTDKASLDPYRHMSRKTIQLVKKLLPATPAPRIERASVDEFYLDLSAQVYNILLKRYPALASLNTTPVQKLPLPDIAKPLDWQTDKVMAPPESSGTNEPPDWDDVVISIGADIIRSIREEIRQQLGLTTSAGVSHNKLLAKVASRMNKPAGQTVIRRKSVSSVLSTLKATSLPGLGRQLGQKVVQNLGSDYIFDLLQVPLGTMKTCFGIEQAQWVYGAIRGDETGAVVPRSQVQSLLSAKTFVPPIACLQQASKWLQIFGADLEARLRDLDVDSDFPRRPRTIAVHHHIRGRFGPTKSKQAPIPPQIEISRQTIFDLSYVLLKEVTAEGESWPCQSISVSLSNMNTFAPEKGRITSFFSAGSGPASRKRRRDSRNSRTIIDDKKQHISGLVSEQSRPRGLSDVKSMLVARESGTSGGTPVNPSSSRQLSQYECPICGESVQHECVLEHLDWHVAVDIQNEQGES